MYIHCTKKHCELHCFNLDVDRIKLWDSALWVLNLWVLIPGSYFGTTWKEITVICLNIQWYKEQVLELNRKWRWRWQSSYIGTTAHCGLWPVEQSPSIFAYLPPTLSIFSLPALEDLFLLPLSIFSWVFPFFLSLPVLEWRSFWASYPVCPVMHLCYRRSKRAPKSAMCVTRHVIGRPFATESDWTDRSGLRIPI